MDNCEILDNVLLKYSGKETAVIIPEGITTIGKEVFLQNYYIKTVKLPLSLVSIEESAFKSSTLKEIVIPENIKEIGTYAFRYCRNLKHLEIQKSTSIDLGSFNQREGLMDKNGFIIVNDVFFGYNGKQTVIKT